MQTRTVTMGTNVYIGLTVTGNSTTTLATGTFDNVTVTGGSSAPTVTPTATATATGTTISLTWTPQPIFTPTPTATQSPTPTPTATPPPSQPEVIVQRTTYTIAGQTVFLRLRTLEDNVEVSNYLYALHSDHLGSTSTLSYLKADGTAGRVLDSRAFYTPFGDYRLQPTGDYTDRGYTGHLGNNSGSNDIGLIYMNARFYVSGIGRFASADTIVPNPADPQSFNRYAYVRNNPVNFTDPSGNIPCTELGTEACNRDGTYVNPDISREVEYARTREKAIQRYQEKFDAPFQGQQRLTSRFGPNHPDGVDWGDDFVVQAPASGVVTRAGSDTPAGIWRIRNIETGESREWSPWNGNALRERDRGEDGLLEPERLLQTDEWVDSEPSWSHRRGTIIQIDHGYNLSTHYYHLDIDDSIVQGMIVNQGDVLATTQNNGWSTGTHLHYGVLFTYQGQLEWLNPILSTYTSPRPLD